MSGSGQPYALSHFPKNVPGYIQRLTTRLGITEGSGQTLLGHSTLIVFIPALRGQLTKAFWALYWT